MHRVSTVIGGLALALYPAAAAAVTIDVPCNVTALAQAFRDVQSAGPDVHLINLAPQCAYVLTAADPQAFDDASPVGLAPIRNRVSVNGRGARIERASAAGTPAFRFFAVAPGAELRLEGVTLRNGLARGERGGNGCTAGGSGGRYGGFGGAVLNLGRLVVMRSWLDGNLAEGGTGGSGYNGAGPGGGGAGIGGAIAQPFAAPTAASIEIVQSALTFNRARGGRSILAAIPNCSGFQSAAGGGGGPGGDGGFRASGATQGQDATAGRPGGGGGGGNFNGFAIGAGGFGGGGGGGNGLATTAPSGTFGGAPDRLGGFGGGTGAGLGGAVFVGQGGASITNSTLHGNQASGANGDQDADGASGVGGSVYVQPTVELTLQFVTMTDGRSDGGIALPGPNNRGNGGGARAGNLYQHPGAGVVSSLGSVIAGGVVAAGLGNGSGVAGTAVSPDVQVILQSSQFNVYGTTTGITGLSPSDLAAADPGLQGLGGASAAPPVRAPLVGSVVLDRVPLQNCPLTQDQRGQPRPLGAACDAGAVEGLALNMFGDGFEPQ